MIALVAAVVAFSGFALLLLAWAEHDYEQHGTLTWKSAIGAWMLYLFHADTVGTAAFTDIGRLDVGTPGLVIGAAVGAVGVSQFLAAVVALVRRGGFDGLLATHLVTDGAFGLSRHPQNVGWALILLGFALGSGSIVALLLVALFGVFAHRYAQLEERHLAGQFGTAYAAYAARVPAYVKLPGRKDDGPRNTAQPRAS